MENLCIDYCWMLHREEPQQCTREKVLNGASRRRRRDVRKIFDIVVTMTSN